jgi:hypothetical protein
LELSWLSSTFPLIADSATALPKLSVSFDGQALNTLSVTQVYLWNSGNTTIRDEDLDSDPDYQLRIETSSSDTEILDVDEAIHMSEKASEFCANKLAAEGGACRRVVLGFRYLEPKRGAALSIYHTGRERRSIIVHGKLIGGVIQRGRGAPQLSAFTRRMLYSTLVLFTIIPVAMLTYFSMRGFLEGGTVFNNLLLAILFFGLVGYVLAIGQMAKLLRNPSNVPRDLLMNSRWDTPYLWEE